MSNNGTPRRPADCPEWGWVLIQGIQEFGRQAVEDRRQAAEDRRGIRENLKVLADTQATLARLQVSMADQLADIRGHLVQISVAVRSIAETQKEQTKVLKQILRAVTVRGNGRNGNGRA